MFGAQFGQQRETLGVDRRETAIGQRVDEFVFRSEVVIDRGQIDLGKQRDVPQRHAVESACGVNPLGGFEDALAGILGGFLTHTDV